MIELFTRLPGHDSNVIMSTMESQITSLTIFYSTAYSGADQRKHQNSASLAFVWGIHRGPVNSTHKWSAKRKMFPFDDVIMRWLLYPCHCHTYTPLCYNLPMHWVETDKALCPMITSSNGNILCVPGPLCIKAGDAELWCFLWSVPWINGWVNNREPGDLRRHRAHYDVIVMHFFHRGFHMCEGSYLISPSGHMT